MVVSEMRRKAGKNQNWIFQTSVCINVRFSSYQEIGVTGEKINVVFIHYVTCFQLFIFFVRLLYL